MAADNKKLDPAKASEAKSEPKAEPCKLPESLTLVVDIATLDAMVIDGEFSAPFNLDGHPLTVVVSLDAEALDRARKLLETEAELAREKEEHAATKQTLKLAGEAAVNSSMAASNERKKREAMSRGVPSNGAELVQRLKESHSPDNKLRPARDCLARVKFEEGRVATCKEVFEAIAEAYPESAILDKARQIMEVGVWTAPEQRKAPPIEDTLLGKG